MRRNFFGYFNQAPGEGSGSGQGAPPAGAAQSGAAAGAPPVSGVSAGAPAAGASLLGGAAGGTPQAGAPATGTNWRESILPKAWTSDPAMQPFTGFETPQEMVEALGKSYLETKRLVGAKAPTRPADDAPPEEQAAWRKLVGAPDTPEGYGETLRPDNFPEELWGKELETEFRGLAHKHGLTPAAAKEIAALHARLVDQGLEANEAEEAAAFQRESATLRREWGDNFDKNAHHAVTVARAAGLDPLDPIFKEAKYAKAFFALSQMIGEKTLPVGPPTTPGNALVGRIRDIMDPKSNTTEARAYRGELGQERALEVANALGPMIEEAQKQGFKI